MPMLRMFGYTPWKANYYYLQNLGFDTDSATRDYAEIRGFCLCLPIFDKSVLMRSPGGDKEFRVTGISGGSRGTGYAEDRLAYNESDRVNDSEFGSIGLSGGSPGTLNRLEEAYGAIGRAAGSPTGSGEGDRISLGGMSSSGDGYFDSNYVLGFVRGQWPYAEHYLSDIRNYVGREHNLASAFMHIIANYMISQRAAITEYIADILYLKTVGSSIKVDYGLHNILASTDILLKKSGYYFCDLEKFIRKGSVLSTVCDVDKLIKFMPSMNQALNHAVQLYNTRYINNTLSSFEMKLERNLGPYYGGTESTSGFTKFHFDSATNIASLGAGESPLVYSKIEKLASTSGFTFKSFFDSTAYTDIMTTDSGGSYDGFSYGASVNLEMDRDFNNAVNEMNSGVEYSHLALRNYAFNEWSSYLLPTLIDGRKFNFREDYRLLCFYYQYFIDDDKAFIGDPEDTVNSTDEIYIEVNLSDMSHRIMRKLADTFATYYDRFVSDYYDLAIENCAYDKYNLKYNTFFIDSMLADYDASSLSESPWYLMVATYATYLQIFTDMFGGSYASQIEFANNILDGIRPETGRLDNLIDFAEQCRIFDEILEAKALAAEAEFEGRVIDGFEGTILEDFIGEDFSIATEYAPWEGYTANGCLVVSWAGDDAIKRPVIDHIGDYTGAPNIGGIYSEFGDALTTDI